MSSKLNEKVKGAWLLHHDQKLALTTTIAFDNISLAGRSARLLSVISKEDQREIDMERLNALARSLNIRPHEAIGLLVELKSHGLVDYSSTGVTVLGVSQSSLLKHTSDIFDSKNPTGLEEATLYLAEEGSHSPLRRSDCEQEIADIYRLSTPQLDELFNQSMQIGFVDYDGSGNDRLYFNGALFKRDQASKAKSLLENLPVHEQSRLLQADQLLLTHGCVEVRQLERILGKSLWRKLHHIAYFEVCTVSNEVGQTYFATKPEAIAKFIPDGLADVLDDAKALAASLTYGIVKSNNSRGRIHNPMALINSLIDRGYVEGRAAALKEDYKVLEQRGVVSVESTAKGYKLSLEKPEIGKMAKELILKGEASTIAAEVIVGETPVNFNGPDHNRQIERKLPIDKSALEVSQTLNTLRKF